MQRVELGFSVIVLGILFASLSTADILLTEDFEDAAKYESDWIPTAGWSLVEDVIAGENTTVLDVNGGEVGLSVRDDLGDFEMEADFKVVNGYLGFIVRAQDTNNLYMIQMTTAESAVTPNNLRWHTKVGGAWTALPEPYLFEINKDIWYHIRIEAIGDVLRVYVGESEDGRDKVELIAEEWEAPAGDFAAGAIGFRESGGENGRVDNIILATPGGLMAVEPGSKLAICWGDVKK
jgi:hypothetical protein